MIDARPIYARCPVPWCDSDDVSSKHFDAKRRKHWLQCNDCGFSTPQMPSRAKAERLWNERRQCACNVDRSEVADTTMTGFEVTVPFSVRAKVVDAIEHPETIVGERIAIGDAIERYGHWQARAVMAVIFLSAAHSPMFADALKSILQEKAA